MNQAPKSQSLPREDTRKTLHEIIFPLGVGNAMVPQSTPAVECRLMTFDNQTRSNERPNAEDLWILFILNRQPIILSQNDVYDLLDPNELSSSLLIFPIKYYCGKDFFTHFVKETRRTIKKHKLEFITSNHFVVGIRNSFIQSTLKFCFIDVQKLKAWWNFKNPNLSFRSLLDIESPRIRRKTPFILKLIKKPMKKSSELDRELTNWEGSSFPTSTNSPGDDFSEGLDTSRRDPTSSISTPELHLAEYNDKLDPKNTEMTKALLRTEDKESHEQSSKIAKLKDETEELFIRIDLLTVENKKLKDKLVEFEETVEGSELKKEAGTGKMESPHKLSSRSQSTSPERPPTIREERKPSPRRKNDDSISCNYIDDSEALISSLSSISDKDPAGSNSKNPRSSGGKTTSSSSDDHTWNAGNTNDTAILRYVHIQDTTTIDRLQESLCVNETLVDQIHSKGVIAKQELNKALDQVEMLQSEIDRLAGIVDQYKRRENQEEVYKTKLANEIDHLTTGLKRKNKKIFNLMKENDKKNVELKALEERLKKTEQKLKKSEETVDELKKMEDQIKTLNEKLADYESQIDHMDREFSSHMMEVNKYIAKQQEIKQQLECDLAVFKKDRETLQAEIKRHLQIQETFNIKVTELNTKCSNLKLANKRLTTQLDDSTNHNNKLTNQLHDLTTENEKLAEKNTQYEIIINELTKFQRTADSYKSLMQEYEVLSSQLRNELELKENILDHTNKTLEGVSQELNSSKSDLEKSQKAAYDLREQLRSTTSKLVSEMHILGHDKVQTERSLTQISHQKKNLEEIHEKLCTKLIKAVRMIMDGKLLRAHLEHKLKSSEETIGQLKTYIHDLEKKVRDTEAEAVTARRDLADMEVENGKLLRRIIALEKSAACDDGGKVEGLENALNVLEEKIKNERNEFDLMMSIKNSALEQKDNYITTLQDRLMSVTKSLNDTRDDFLNQKQIHSALKNRILALETEKKEMEMTVSDLRDKLEHELQLRNHMEKLYHGEGDWDSKATQDGIEVDSC